MKHVLSKAWLAAASVAAAALLLLSACQTDGMRDSSGRGMQVTEWKSIDVSEVDLNLPLLLPKKVTKVDYQLRDNAVYHHRMQFGSKGLAFTQHFWDAWYSDQSEKDLDDIEAFKKKLPDACSGAVAGTSDIRKIERKGKRTVGYAAILEFKDPTKGKCFYSRAGYRLKPSTAYDNDYGNVDTIVVIVNHDPDLSFEDFDNALQNVDRIKDREAFAAALAAK